MQLFLDVQRALGTYEGAFESATVGGREVEYQVRRVVGREGEALEDGGER